MLLSDRYELGDVIGVGGMADVHAAVDQRLRRDVAVKIMRPGTAPPADMEARFEDEARVAARLTHPNVVAVYDTGVTDDGRPFIVMERLPGETLADRMRDGALPDAVIRSVADDVLGALAAAHAAGIVHRDIKPGNILLTEEGRAKIADFGIARESDSLLVDPTTTHALTGTPAYLAPERIDGQPATARSDIWALGVVLYEALAGRKPFDGPTPIAVAIAVREDNPAPLAELRPGADPAIASAVGRAMAADPADRFATAGEMRAAMSSDPDATIVQAAAPVPAADATQTLIAPAPLAAAWWRRIPTGTIALAGGAAAAAVLAILIGVAVSGGNDKPTPARPASALVTTTAPPVSTTTTIAPGARIEIQVPVPTVRRGDGKKKRGGKD